VANEEFLQRGYYTADGKVKGDAFGKFEQFELGNSNLNALLQVGLIESVATEVKFPFEHYKIPQKSLNSKPDSVYARVINNSRTVVANREVKKPSEFNSEQKLLSALEQGLYVGALLQVEVSIITDGNSYHYIDIKRSLEIKEIVKLPEIETSTQECSRI